MVCCGCRLGGGSFMAAPMGANNFHIRGGYSTSIGARSSPGNQQTRSNSRKEWPWSRNCRLSPGTLAAQGLGQIRNHPLLGQSIGDLSLSLSDLSQGQHIVDFVNSHLFVAMTAGLPLSLLWFIVWLVPVADGFRQDRKIPLYASPIGIAIPTFVALIFTSLVDRNLTWLIVALAFSVPCVLIKQASGRHALPPSKRPENVTDSMQSALRASQRQTSATE